MHSDNNVSMILDTGATYTRLGQSFDEAPRVNIPTLVARPRQAQLMAGSEYTTIETGFAAYKKRYTHDITWPFMYGDIKDWDGISSGIH